MSDTCPECGLAILWTRDLKGTATPLDAEPVPNGLYVVIDGVAQRMRPGQLAHGEMGRTNHFMTCVKRKTLKKKKEIAMADPGTKHPMMPTPPLKEEVPTEEEFKLEDAAETPVKPKKRMLSDELAAMSKIDRIIAALPESTRMRVLRWLGDPSRFGLMEES